MCISFIHNLSMKADSHNLIELLTIFTLSSILTYDVTHLALTQYQKSRWADQSIWWFRKWPVLCKICIHRDIKIIKLNAYDLENLDLCIIYFLPTRLTFAVIYSITKIAKTISITHNKKNPQKFKGIHSTVQGEIIKYQ